MKSIKSSNFFFLFHFRIFDFFQKKKRDNMAQDIATVKNEKKKRKRERPAGENT